MRVNIVKSKNAKQVYIIESKRVFKKNTTTIVEKLGNMDSLIKIHGSEEKALEFAKERAAYLTQLHNQKKAEEKESLIDKTFNPNKQIEKDKSIKFNAGYLFLQDIYYDLKMNNIVRNIKARHKYEYDLNEILRHLIFSRIINPSSKLSSYHYSFNYLESPTYELHDVYRALSILAEESDYIQSELYKNSHFAIKRNTDTLYYDCTNCYFEIEMEDDFRKYGKCKENRPNPIVTVGLFMDGDGLPLAIDALPGNKNEQLSLRPLESKIIKDYELSEFIYCSDSGLASKNNKLFNSIGNRKFVITQSLKKLKKDDLETALNPTQFRKVGSDKFIDISKLDEDDENIYNDVYYKEIPLNNEMNERIVVTYSLKYKKYQEKIRQGQIDRAIKMISKGGKLRKGTNQNDPKRFIEKVSYTETGEVASKENYSLDIEAIANEAKYDGFYAVSTNVDKDVNTIININRRRWEIEESFRIMKHEFKMRPIELRLEDRIKAHLLTCFLSLFIYRILEKKLESKYTTSEIIETLRNYEVIDEGVGYSPIYTRKDIHDDLHKKFDFTTDREIISYKKMKNIIHNTKQ